MTTSADPAAFDITAAKRQLQQLQELHASGALSPESYEEGRAQLERRILDWVLRDTAADAAPLAPPVAKPPLRLLGILAGVVVLVAAAGYGWIGHFSPGSADRSNGGMERGAPVADAGAANKPHATNFDQIAAMTEKLAAKLQDKPQDAEGWAMLARSYSVLGRNPEAIAAYEKAVALRATDAVLLADYADALALKNNRSLAGEPWKIVERALKMDPRNLKALSLAGSYAFEKKDYAGAVKYWDQVVQFGAAEDSLVEQVQPGLAEARALAGLPPASKVALPAKPVADAVEKTVSGTVTLAPALVREAKPEDTVFIFARAVEGSRMPLAIMRKQVKDLPIRFTLDDSMAMSPASRLSQADRVLVGVRISKSGNAMPEKGDLSGQSSAVVVGTQNLSIEIKEFFKP